MTTSVRTLSDPMALLPKNEHSSDRSLAVEKALDVLMAFVPNNEPMGAIEVSKHLEIPTSTASRILLTLSKRGFLQQNPDTRKFRLGRLPLDMKRALINSLDSAIVQVAEPYMRDLAAALNASVLLEQLLGRRIVLMHVAHSTRLRVAGEVGDTVPAHAAAGAKAILAFSQNLVVNNILGGRSVFLARTAKTITNLNVLMQDLRKTRRRGFSVDNEEMDIGVKAIGFPLFSRDSIPVAALVAAFPSYQLSPKIDPHILSQVEKAVAAISKELLE